MAGSSYYSGYGRSWIQKLRAEIDGILDKDKERFTAEKMMYIPRNNYEIEAQSELDSYGRTDTYYVTGIYLKKIKCKE